MTKLESLALAYTEVSDALGFYLAGLEALRTLRLTGCPNYGDEGRGKYVGVGMKWRVQLEDTHAQLST